MLNRWENTPDGEVAQLVHQSHLVGLEEDLVLWGGGNNSLKSRSTDLLGAPIEVMYIKSSGSDMKSIVPKQFPAVRLDFIAPLRLRVDDMTDQEMVDYLARCLIDPSSARPSIETLLHAFLPAKAVQVDSPEDVQGFTVKRLMEARVDRELIHKPLLIKVGAAIKPEAAQLLALLAPNGLVVPAAEVSAWEKALADLKEPVDADDAGGSHISLRAPAA